MNREMIDRRFRLTVASERRDGSDLGHEVVRGLRTAQKSLPCRFFYDEIGSRLFEEICELPEYYLTRAEDEILAQHSAQIVACMPVGTGLFELGSGSAQKTRRVIDAFLARSRELVYTPIDISQSMLEASSRNLLSVYPTLVIDAVAAEYESAPRILRAERDRPKLVLWLGSNVGNLDRCEAARFLAKISSCLECRDRLLVGIDLRKPGAVLERAYDDSHGVTARFNLNLLARINDELGGHFDTTRFRHAVRYDEVEGRVEMYLESLCAQRVRIDRLDVEISFSRGERIHTENSYKYSRLEIEELCRAAQLSIERTWLDSEARFSVHLLAPAE